MITVHRSEKDGKYYWQVKAENNELVATGHEGFNRPANPLKGLRALKKILENWDGQTYLLEKTKQTRKKKNPIQGELITDQNLKP